MIFLYTGCMNATLQRRVYQLSMAVGEKPQGRWRRHRTRVFGAHGEGLSLEVKRGQRGGTSETSVELDDDPIFTQTVYC